MIDKTACEQALDLAAERAIAMLRGTDLDRRAKGLGLAPPESDGTIVVPVFGAPLAFTPPDYRGTIKDATPSPPAHPQDRILALHYLLPDGQIPLPDDLISFRDLPGGVIYSEPFLKRSVDLLTRHFGNDIPAIRGALARFPASFVSFGDLGARIEAVGLIDVTLIYRVDDEFGPDANVLFDRVSSRVLSTEDLAVLAGRLCQRMVRYRRHEMLSVNAREEYHVSLNRIS